MKSFVNRALSWVPSPVADWLHTQKHRRHWLRQGRSLHATYLDQYRTRADIIGLVRLWVGNNSFREGRVTVVEFGCAAANNLRLLGEMLSMPVTYIGYDLQPDAIALGREQFVGADLRVGDDKAFLDDLPSLGSFDVFLASGVLAYLPENKCFELIAAAAKRSRCIAICDDLSCFDRTEGQNDGLFLHPYRRLCAEAGLTVSLGPTLAQGGSRYSSFIAVAEAAV